ncbi:hypothetical protein C8Q76DRAFT_729660 [Earliella scabrosa]|nr:hypothetical protein C8Q76DRAFT_729660 [Earliella scabrosa]
MAVDLCNSSKQEHGRAVCECDGELRQLRVSSCEQPPRSQETQRSWQRRAAWHVATSP